MPKEYIYLLIIIIIADKSGKAMHLTYADKCRLVALSQQISCGPFNSDTAEMLGPLDVVGRDRRLDPLRFFSSLCSWFFKFDT